MIFDVFNHKYFTFYILQSRISKFPNPHSTGAASNAVGIVASKAREGGRKGMVGVGDKNEAEREEEG